MLYASHTDARSARTPGPATDSVVERELCHWLSPVHGTVEYPEQALETGIVLLYSGEVGLLLHRYHEFDESEETRRVFAALTRRSIAPGLHFSELVGESRAMQDVRRTILRWARSQEPVLIEGETGAGKELCAQAIHLLSGRSGPWNEHNLSIESRDAFNYVTLFGRADTDQKGMAEKSHDGTLFLDEIGRAENKDQQALLKFLDSKQVVPLGGSVPRRVDTRIIGGTDKPHGIFAPLHGRLNALPLRVPPLRERRDDVGRIFYHFIRSEFKEQGKRAKLDLTHQLDAPGEAGPWVGAEMACVLAAMPLGENVREVRNLAVRLVAAHHDRATCELESALLDLRRKSEQGAEPAPVESTLAESTPSGSKTQSGRANAAVDPIAKAWSKLKDLSPQEVQEQFQRAGSFVELARACDPSGAKSWSEGDKNRFRQRVLDVLGADYQPFSTLPYSAVAPKLQGLLERKERLSVEQVAAELETNTRQLRRWLRNNAQMLSTTFPYEWLVSLHPGLTNKLHANKDQDKA
jgi:DNA-binding NtrC family response regulator